MPVVPGLRAWPDPYLTRHLTQFIYIFSQIKLHKYINLHIANFSGIAGYLNIDKDMFIFGQCVNPAYAAEKKTFAIFNVFTF